MRIIIGYEQFLAAAVVLLVFCGAITTIGSAWGYVKAWRKPARDMVHRVDRHAECLDRDDKRIGDLEESNRLIMRGVMQLMSHEIDGNHVDKLRDARDAMEQYLISK